MLCWVKSQFYSILTPGVNVSFLSLSRKGAVIHPFPSLNLLDKSVLAFLVCIGELPCRFRLVYNERIWVTFLSHQFSDKVCVSSFYILIIYLCHSRSTPLWSTFQSFRYCICLCFPEALESSEDYLEFIQTHSKLSVWTEIWKLHKIRSNLYEVSTAPSFCQSGGMKSSASLVVLWLQVPAKANKMQRCAKMLK